MSGAAIDLDTYVELWKVLLCCPVYGLVISRMFKIFFSSDVTGCVGMCGRYDKYVMLHSSARSRPVNMP